jgi:hypothetical protein
MTRATAGRPRLSHGSRVLRGRTALSPLINDADGTLVSAI